MELVKLWKLQISKNPRHSSWSEELQTYERKEMRGYWEDTEIGGEIDLASSLDS